MKPLRMVLEEKKAAICATIVNDDKRRDLIFISFNLIMGIVSGFMTVVNLFTDKQLLMRITLIFALLCFLNVTLFYYKRRLRFFVRCLFLLEAVVLCGFFCISGTPEGFSALWTCFIPSFTITLLGSKWGSLYSALAFVMIAVLFWTPAGQALLQYPYTDSFMLRFPMIYIAFFLVGLLLESIRATTQKQLVETESKYQYL